MNSFTYILYILAKCGIFVLEKSRRYLAFVFFPIAKIIINKRTEKMGLKFVKGKPQDETELGIVKNELEVYLRLAESLTYGFFTCCEDKLIICKDFPNVIHTLLRNGHSHYFRGSDDWLFRHFNLQTGSMAWKVASHYDTGNDLYKKMLDPYMQYTCAYWRNATTLEQAQLDKMELICQKLKLKPGMKVLELGCGFGGFAKYMAEKYQVSVTGVSVSKEQTALAREICQGLPAEFLLCDYKELKLSEKFDRVVAIGLLEHVGLFNYRGFYEIASKALKDDGLLLTHNMGVNSTIMPVAEKYISEKIFPNGGFPKLEQLILSSEDLFVIEDIHNIGADYLPTLKAWEQNFDKGWPELESKYGEKFYNMWKIYLQLAQGLLGSRSVQLYQIVYSKKGILGGYQSPR